MLRGQPMSQPQHHREFLPSGFFACRTPLLPFTDLLAWSAGLQAPSALDDPAALAKAVADDRQLLRERLQNALMRPEIREAIFVASPDLDDGFDRWQRDPESDKGLRAERALARYYQRMASRATPFGLFAGCSVGTIGAESRLTVAARQTYRRHTRLDMDYLYALVDALEQDAALRQAVSTIRTPACIAPRDAFVTSRRDSAAPSGRIFWWRSKRPTTSTPCSTECNTGRLKTLSLPPWSPTMRRSR